MTKLVLSIDEHSHLSQPGDGEGGRECVQDVRHLVPQVLDLLPQMLSRLLVHVFSLFSFFGGFVDVIGSDSEWIYHFVLRNGSAAYDFEWSDY